jgi:hypothetical protein
VILRIANSEFVCAYGDFLGYCRMKIPSVHSIHIHLVEEILSLEHILVEEEVIRTIIIIIILRVRVVSAGSVATNKQAVVGIDVGR